MVPFWRPGERARSLGVSSLARWADSTIPADPLSVWRAPAGPGNGVWNDPKSVMFHLKIGRSLAQFTTLLCERHPERYHPTQVRTLQRHIAKWKALHGQPQEVIFEQRHTPGERAQSDFTHMEDLRVTIGGEAFPHLVVYHFVLTYSNMEAVSICFSETFEALAEGIEKAVWQLGGVPQQHRTDHLSAAVRHLPKTDQEEWTQRYQALMAHYGIQPTWNNTGIAHENGDVEQSHHRFKQVVDQALRARGSRDFTDRAAYQHFLQTLVSKRNQTRTVRLKKEIGRAHV